MNVTVRAEDIMTPRYLLEHRSRDAEAEKVANRLGFDAIPISRADGRVLEFWSRPDKRRIRIQQKHRAAHDAAIESLLSRLGAHVVQFVYYHSEVVGLIDASDLNKPMARIGWLHPMLELERYVLDAARALNVSENEQATVLGRKAAAGARKRQGKAKRHDVELPLLEYAQFAELLRAGARLRLHDLDDSAIDELNAVRNRAAHSGDVVVESRTDCLRIKQALSVARKAARDIRARRRRRKTSQLGRSSHEA
jgi:hypothetical protein